MAVNTWNNVTTDKNTVCWAIYDQAGNPYYTPPGGNTIYSLQQIKDDPTWGPIIFGVGAKVVGVQLGVGSSNQTSTSYIDYIETNLLNNGNRVDFNEAPPTPITSIGTPAPSACGTLNVPVTVKDFKDIGAISAVLNFDPTKLQLLPITTPPFQGVTLNPALATAAPFGNNTEGEFRLGDFPVPAITLPDDEVLFTLHFNVLPAALGGSTTPLTWSTVSQWCEYAGPGGTPTYVSTFNNGTVTIPVWPVVNTSTGNSYCTIQEAINAASAGNTITVAAGIYAEDIIVDKALTLLGPNAEVNACSGTRVAEAIIVPATSSPFGEIIKVQASNVTIKGFTIDGDNTALPPSLLLGTNGATLDAAEAVTVYVDNVNNLTVSNNIIQNLTFFGVTLYGASGSAPSTTGHLISNNLFKDLGTYTDPETVPNNNMNFWGGGVLLYNNQYAAVTNNCMSNVRLGVQTGNYSRANTGTTASQVISGNTIEARKRGIFHNLFYSNASTYTISNNTVTGLANANETTFWDGIFLCSMSVPSTASGNIINGSEVTAIPTTGIPVWNCTTAPLISGGSISGVGLGINVNNFESYPSTGSNANNTSATIDGVTISGTSIAGIKVHDNPSNTNGSTASAEIKNINITATNVTGIWILGSDAFANIHDNTIAASVAGINVNGTATDATKTLTIAGNVITLSGQYAGSIPSVGIALSKVTGTANAIISGNEIANSFYGYLIYNLNTIPTSSIAGGKITGVMQGVSVLNLDPVGLSLRAPSTLNISNIVMSGFTGTGGFHAGVYVYTGGTNAADVITATIDKVSVTGTGKTQQDCAGLSFADFSTGTGVRQNITVTECTITDNLNRGINIRGENADVTVLRSTLTGNGADAYGAGGNDGYGIVTFAGAKATVENNFIINPATSATEVSALFTFPYPVSEGGTIIATNNSLDRNGNGWLAKNAGGTLTATCNWLGSTLPATNASAVSGTVAYNPWLCSGIDTDGATAGFQGVPCNTGAPIVGTNGAGSVQCLSSATPPATPEVKDVDGETNLVAVLVSTVDNPDPLTCEGTRTYTYSYTNCSGISALWSFVYTIDRTTAPVVPADGGSVVECISDIPLTPPTPPVIVDVCDATVLAVAAVPAYVDEPATITCEGTRTYSFTYTDCAGLVSTWKYVYTVKHLTAPAEVGGPVANSSTVECESAAVEPTEFPVVQDVCGNTLTPGAPVKNTVFVNKFDEAVTLSETQAAGVWYTDRYAPAGFETASFDAGNRLKHSISAADGASSRPGGFSGAFYDTQGRKYDLGTATDVIEVKLYIPSDWQASNKRMAGLWGTAVNASDVVSAYPLVEFTSDGGVPRFRVWEGNGTWVDIGLPVGFVYNSWVTLKLKLLSNGQFLVSAGSLNYVTKFFSATTVRIINVILQGHNTTSGVNYDIYWDDFTWNDTYTALTCKGAVSYTYNYADCAGLAYVWTYTYTIDRKIAPAEVGEPVATASTVQCVSAATAPAPASLPVVQDICGTVLTPGSPVMNSVYVNKFDEAVTLSASAGLGVWYTDRYAPAGFETAVFDGGNRLKHSISATDGASSRPGGFSGAFYDTQGRKYDLGTATDVIEVKLYIPSDWQASNKRMAGLWGTAVNASDVVSAYPLVEFTSDGGVPRFRVWEGNGTWVDIGLPVGFVYNSWVTLKLKLLSNGQFLVSAGSLNYVTKFFSATTVRIINVILQGHNTTIGVNYDIYWDDFTWNDTYTAITCEGVVSYTYNYVDCAGLTYAWTYTYTIDRVTPPAEVGVPVENSSIVYSIAAATPPALPVVNDVCGTVLNPTPESPVMVDNITGCIGTRTYTYTYVDCANLQYIWTYTYTLSTSTVSGTLKYNNSAKTPMNLVKMVIKDATNTQVGAEVTTTGTGAFTFPDLCAGTYTIHVTFNEKDAGGINATDAAQVNAWSVTNGSAPIEHVKFLAGDVTFDKFISSADALKIQRYFVFGDVFAAPKWSYWKKGEIINSNLNPYATPAAWPTEITVTVAGDVPNLDLYGMLTGDYDGSLIPTVLKSTRPSLSLVENSNLQVSASQAFELPMRAASAMQVGAVSMILDIPSELVKVQNVTIKGSNDPVMWSMEGNELRIGWHSINPINVAENGTLLTLELMTTNAFTLGRTLDIALPFDPLNELADGRFEVMENVELKVAKVGNGILGNLDIDKNGGLLFSNYPNPFSKATTIEYSLPVDGKVTINLYNNLGQLMSVLVSADQKAGQHTFRYESNTLQPGIYVAKLQLVNSETNLVGTIKLNLHK